MISAGVPDPFELRPASALPFQGFASGCRSTLRIATGAPRCILRRLKVGTLPLRCCCFCWWGFGVNGCKAQKVAAASEACRTEFAIAGQCLDNFAVVSGQEVLWQGGDGSAVRPSELQLTLAYQEHSPLKRFFAS